MNPTPHANRESTSSHPKSAISTAGFLRIAGLCWVILLLAGFLQLQSYRKTELKRETARLEETLRLEAEYQKAELEQWLAAKENAITTLASNTALQLYLTTITQADQPSIVTAESTYIMNFLIATAEQAGFTPPLREIDRRRAGVAQKASAGIAVVNAQGAIIASSGALPDISTLLSLFTSHPTIPPSIERYGPYLTHEKTPLLVLKAPVFSVQVDPKEDTPIGYILATSVLDAPFSAMLESPLGNDSAAHSHLLKPIQNEEYQRIASALNNPPPLANKAELAAIRHAMRIFHSSNTVASRLLALALPIESSPDWILIRAVDGHIALADTISRLNWLIAAYWLVAFSFTLIALFFWRSATHWRLQSLMTRLSAHEALLRIVTDSLPVRIFILDRQKHLRFVNQPAASHHGMEPAAMIGKATEHALGRACSDELAEPVARTLLQQSPQRECSEIIDTNTGIATNIERSFVPLSNLPDITSDQLPAIMVMEHDITALVHAQRTHQQILTKLVDTLVMLADQRDPHTGKHSGSVALVARAIAKAMRRSEDEIETVALAGRLVNLGKLLVPDTLLTQTGKLQADDRAIFDSSYQKLLRYLEDIPFQLPVVPTLRQMPERIDGGGPLKLAADQILTTAKILAVANSFVALVSPRAYREALSVDDAMDQLGQESTRYAPEVVTALRHYLDNLGGKNEWQEYRRAL